MATTEHHDDGTPHLPKKSDETVRAKVVQESLSSNKFHLLAVVLTAGFICSIGYWSIIRQYRRGEEAKLPARTFNKEALRLYVEGRFYWSKRTPDLDEKAITLFEEALHLDPNYALAYSGLADAYAVTASGLPAIERWVQARSDAERALALDESSAEAYTSRAFILYKFEWNWSEAERYFRRALQLNPNYVLAHHWFGEFLVLRGLSDEGLAQLRQAESLDPFSLRIKSDLARALYRTRRYDETITEAKHLLELDPNYKNAYETLTYAYEQKHDYPQAIEADLQVLRLSNKSEKETAALRRKFIISGWHAYWVGKLQLLQKEAQEGFVPAYFFAETYMRLGNREAALHFLEKGFDERSDAPLLVGVEPLMYPLRSDSRFINLLRRAGLQ